MLSSYVYRFKMKHVIEIVSLWKDLNTKYIDK